MQHIPSSLSSIAQDAPVFARMLLRNNKELNANANVNMDITFFPRNRRDLASDCVEKSVVEFGDDETNNAMVVKNSVLRSGNNTVEIDTYMVIDEDKPIGSSKDGSMKIYKAVWELTTLVLKRSVALKVADNPESMAKLRGEVTRSLAVKGEHRNLLRFKTCFMDEQSAGKLCVVMPLTHGSLRTIMQRNHWFWQGGFPEAHVVSVLRSVLCALRFLHTQHIFHGDINTGHIYLCNPSHPLYYHCSEIALGFAATIYEDDDEEEMGNTNVTSAPEIYYGNQPYSEKADIWLVGITALELAFGGCLKVANGNALEAMIKEIHDNKKLPSNNIIIYHKEKTMQEDEYEYNEAMNKLKDYIKKWVPFWSSVPEIAGTFVEIVVQCLYWDPKNRPSVDTLLSHPCFNRRLPVSDYDFYDFVMSNKN